MESLKILRNIMLQYTPSRSSPLPQAGEGKRTNLLCRHSVWLALIVLTMTGCETMSKEECLSADWYHVGFKDGRAGEQRSRIEAIAESCAKANVTPKRGQYFAGRERGLLEYCTPEHALELGINGTSYTHVCPPRFAADFEHAYSRGKRVYDARQKVKRLEGKLDKTEEKLSKEKDDKEKKHLRDELEELDGSLESARDRLRRVENNARYRD